MTAADPAPLVVITDWDLPDDGTAVALLSSAGLRVHRANCRQPDDVIRAACDATAILVQWAPITAEVLDELTHCRFISRLGIGYDMIDVDAASRRGIAVANTPDYCVDEVATHAVAMILALSRRLLPLDGAVRAGRWSVLADASQASRPDRTTLAVIGFGRIGSLVAAHARALGFTVVVHDPGVSADDIGAAGHRPVDLAPALGSADIISLHAPLTAKTRHLLDREAIRRLKPGSLVVNTCRGGLVDETALAEALRSGYLGGAALDVFETEPLPADSPLRDAPNLLLTPHAAWYSPTSIQELPRRAAGQIVDFLAGRAVNSIVNPHARR
ncbi:C-terminal binding protein [Virgisporangium aurantiacum]|uniref:D-isomer specific 2-hydroxyacid dehydrogenase family protein n=1 Tax=Virgisporangium aurantiacum TaxID=175570 RepID=A0A8J3ZFG7_9ACTN|nr:C-terminal binding protein [Virgisporangium aurantiacum]GIJ63184.1 D-isomer specific 2-hydroxyacid dehydrogenase family protein [Virgisporangium aurantiacum]